MKIIFTMIPRFFLAVLNLVAYVYAAPLEANTSHSLEKRANPRIGPGFSRQEVRQISDGFQDAIRLAQYVVFAPSDIFDPIFVKYFDIRDRRKVTDVFRRILGLPPNLESGARLLGDISVVVDYEDEEGDLACDGSAGAESRNVATDHLNIIICHDLGFENGGIFKGYPDVDPVTCESQSRRVSWRMETMGYALIHEYTHWNKLVAPPLRKGTDDLVYGPYGVREMRKSRAVNNADSYAWLANEILWTTLCHRTYGDPRPEDDNPE